MDSRHQSSFNDQSISVAEDRTTHKVQVPQVMQLQMESAAKAVLCMRSGHQSFSNSRKVNDLVGNIVHSSILVPYHGWRISHRTHHSNHGHVENDESWHPVTKSIYDKMVRSSPVHQVSLVPL